MSKSYKHKGFIISLTVLITMISLLLPTKAYYLNTNKPIAKGINGYSCIYLLTFKHESLMPYLKTAESKKGLYLLDLSFIERNEDVLDLLIEQNYPIGLITKSDSDSFNSDVLQKELELFKSKTGAHPLWVTTLNGEFSDELLQASHAATINIVAPNLHFNPSLTPSTLPNGSFLFIKGDQNFNFNSKEHLQLISSPKVRSIEENIFNIKTTDKNMP